MNVGGKISSYFSIFLGMKVNKDFLGACGDRMR